jgi:Ca-activated chloride channel family protein
MKIKNRLDINCGAECAAELHGQSKHGRSRLGLRATVGWLFATAAMAAISPAAGTLIPKGSEHAPIEIVDHQVNVTINNGFAQTVVEQSFSNPNDIALEAIYRFPLPQSASLSEVTLFLGEEQIDGEVLAKERARSVYEQEKASGNDAALAEKNSFRWFEFRVHPVRPGEETRIRIVYYQSLQIDTGIGRYVYPLEEGGTEDSAASSFWEGTNEKVEGTFSAQIELKSASPVADVRLPGNESVAVTEKVGAGHYRVRLEQKEASLNRDLVFYYRLEQELPGRVELVAYKADENTPGTFMMVVTPGIDLKPITGGADYVYVLDTSGSMKGKIQTLTSGVSKVLGKMDSRDRFRVIAFNNAARDVSDGWKEATPENVARAIRQVESLSPGGGTNVYEGLQLAMGGLDDDRATSVVLVTDGVTNNGIVDPRSFHQLMKSHDVRVFGFLLGNSGNWPLMRTICDASGGFYAGVSNADDIVGQIMQAKSKILHECLHDTSLKISGVKTFDRGDALLGKVYRGEQLVIFGRYDKGGEAELELKARLTGEDKTYRTRFEFPDVDTANPEIERLWALSQIEQIEGKRDAGALAGSEASDMVRDLGLRFQLVTDETSMVVLSDEAFDRHGIERHNKQRVARERSAQAARSSQAPSSYVVDRRQPLTNRSAPRHTPRRSSGGGGGGGGGGALQPLMVFAMIVLALGGTAALQGKRENKGTQS